MTPAPISRAHLIEMFLAVSLLCNPVSLTTTSAAETGPSIQVDIVIIESMTTGAVRAPDGFGCRTVRVVDTT